VRPDLLHKLRRAMVNAVREPLRGDVEIDDTWVGGPQPGLRGSRQLKGRKAAIVLTAVEKRGDASNRIRMAVVPDFTQATVLNFVRQHVTPGSPVYTDGYTSFEGLTTAGYRHVARTQPLRTALRRGAPSVVPLADRASGNLQQWLIGTYHGVSKAQLQVYLDEFVFRHNRRRQPMAAFQTVLGLGTGRAPTPYRQIRGALDVAGQL
jgi:transposase-like protein